MIRRILTSAILVPFALSVVFLAPKWLFVAVITGLALVCFHEFAGITRASGIPGPTRPVYLAGPLLTIFPHFEAGLLVIFGVTLMATALRRQDLREALPSAGASMLGVCYCFGAWGTASVLHDVSPHWLVLALSVNWVGDSMALYVGRSWGKHKMAPRISPGKTWEGAIASMITSSLLGMWYLNLVLQVPFWQGLLLTAAANFAGQMGDLAESGLKRGANLKDSSNLLPGHGGWLDRLDSSLFSMPAVYLFVVQPWTPVTRWLH